jgi:hypothetical protein
MSEIGERNFERGMYNSYEERCAREALKARREVPWGDLQPGYSEYAPKPTDLVTGRVIKGKVK